MKLKCKVISTNNENSVIDFGGNIIQMSIKNIKDKYVFVELKNGRYNIISLEEFETVEKNNDVKVENKTTKKSNKKEFIRAVVDDEVVTVDEIEDSELLEDI